ncbi:MAG: hypothetical protein QNJ04_09180 [Desulfobacterales bacterium]|nr:hypothetical protein [Desulfobacterales bacterium]
MPYSTLKTMVRNNEITTPEIQLRIGFLYIRPTWWQIRGSTAARLGQDFFIFFRVKENEAKENARAPLVPARR